MMRRYVIILVAAATLAACSKQAAPPKPPAVTPPASAPAASGPAAPVSLHDQAMALLREGKPLEAAQRLQELAAKEPAVDTYNELSYAYLLGKEYEQAKVAADAALKLDPQHAGALYNRGMATLALNDTNALFYLSQSARLQPDRFEPKVGLARVYTLLRNGALADYFLTAADRLAPGNPEIAAQRQAVSALFVADVAALPAACTAQVKEPAYTLCLVATGDMTYDLILMPAGPGPIGQRLSIGVMNHPDKVVERVQLPGGVTGYWFKQLDWVADMSQWYLVAVSGGKLVPVLFTGDDRGVSDVLRAFADPPTVKGDLIASSAFNASRTGFLDSTWKLSADLTSAALVSTQARGYK